MVVVGWRQGQGFVNIQKFGGEGLQVLFPEKKHGCTHFQISAHI